MPAFIVSFLAGGIRTAMDLKGYFVQHHWMHGKLLFALIVIGIHFDPSRALVLSQVFLSFGIPFAMIPLVMFTRNRKLMGTLVNSRWTNFAAYGVAALIITLNVFLLYQTIFKAS